MSNEDHRQFSEATAVREREWLIPCTIMTALLGLAAVALMPLAGYDHIPPDFGKILNWIAFSFMAGLVVAFLYVIKLFRAGVDAPIAHMLERFKATKGTTLAAVAGMILAGFDMRFFMWIKPEMTAVSPFWADDLLADIDHAIFRTDPWRFFQGVDLSWHAWAYSFFWGIAVMSALVWLLTRKPSIERSTSLLSYFALWSIFGTIGQYLFSAAGPIFYQRVGLGDRFIELERNIPEVTQKVSGYLWNFHTTGELGIGAGISAMPSLHIATVAWIYFVFRGQKSRLAPLAALFAFYIFAMSVALGWHYAIDGIVGALGAWGSQLACGAYLRRRDRRTLVVSHPAPATR